MVGALLAALCFFKHLSDALASCTSQRLFVRLFVRLGLGCTVGLDCFCVCQRCKWTVLVVDGWHWRDELKLENENPSQTHQTSRMADSKKTLYRGCHLVRRGWAVCETATKQQQNNYGRRGVERAQVRMEPRNRTEKTRLFVWFENGKNKLVFVQNDNESAVVKIRTRGNILSRTKRSKRSKRNKTNVGISNDKLG
jgi:hypothetical protein